MGLGRRTVVGKNAHEISAMNRSDDSARRNRDYDIAMNSDQADSGGRRRKLAGYLRAAKELGQSYQQAHFGTREVDEVDELPAIPGAFPDVAIATHGDEQLVLFPSYCKRHLKDEPRLPAERPQSERNSATENDADFWKKEWDRFESDKAIVDVDVRGWLYSPHRGPMTRKNRLLVGLARQLSGVSAPKTPTKSRESSPDRSLKARHEEHEARRDQERIDKEAAEILKRGKAEEEIAALGGYSEESRFHSDNESIYDKSRQSEPAPGNLKPRASWNQPADMSPSEMAVANKNLMTRLMPFLTNPLVATPLTIFFYDAKQSRSKTVQTNEAGHFNIRASLDFVPTHIRVLASENLSAVEEVKITEPKGISVISDVDDTVKHSSIGSGSREIFRNVFIRDLADLSIDGVKEWYNTMFDNGVGFHYVSNSPWQLFPVLVSYFQTAGLPPGSYHLKQYSGMLQGIFEPVAERKKGTLERIMRDFPQRKFLLIGDSGEADLEVYTDVVLANPGRIIGVFIRDVTTPKDQGFFDPGFTPERSSRPGNRLSGRFSRESSRTRVPVSRSDLPEFRPKLPQRGKTEVKQQTSSGPAMGKLIDIGDDSDTVHQPHSRVLPRSNSDLESLDIFRAPEPSFLADKSKAKSPAPPPPAKPVSLRSPNALDMVPPRKAVTQPNKLTKNPPPPPPPRSRGKSDTPTNSNHPLAQSQSISDMKDPHKDDEGYLAAARTKVASAYNAIPSAASYIPGFSNPQQSVTNRSLPDNPSRPSMTSRATTSGRLSNRSSIASISSSENEEGYGGYYGDSTPSTPQPVVNKKLDLWRRRWARAQDILDKNGVELISWRVGSDVAHEALMLIEREMAAMSVKPKDKGGESKVKDWKN